MSVSCRFCDSEFCVKHGFVKGQQRFFCKSCRKRFILRPKLQGYDAQTKIQAIILRDQGQSYRAIAQSLGISYTVARNWVLAPKLAVKRLLEEELYKSGKNIDIISLKEFWQYCQYHVEKFAYGVLLLVPQEKLFPSKLILAARK